MFPNPNDWKYYLSNIFSHLFFEGAHIVSGRKQLLLMLHYEKTLYRQDQEISIVLRFKPE